MKFGEQPQNEELSTRIKDGFSNIVLMNNAKGEPDKAISEVSKEESGKVLDKLQDVMEQVEIKGVRAFNDNALKVQTNIAKTSLGFEEMQNNDKEESKTEKQNDQEIEL